MNEHKDKNGIVLLKGDARKVLKRHYILLLILCLAGVFFGTEFGYVTSHTTDGYNFITGQDPNGTGITVRINDKSLLEICEEKIGIDTDAIKKRNLERAEKIQLAGSQRISKVISRERGIFATAADYFASGSLAETIIDAGATIFHSKSLVKDLLVMLSVAVKLCILIFLQNVYIAVLRRMFLESRIYDQVPVSHLLHFRVVKRWVRASLSMMLVTVLKLLWWLTIAGGVIKRYSYLLVPYIVAENPDIEPKQAVNLSRKMMAGHKFEAFKLDLSFIGWHILGIITFGIVDGLWVVPYKTATFSEYYAKMRRDAKEHSLEGAEFLNDEYLFATADETLLRSTYTDIEENKRYIDEHRITLTPVKTFFAKNFGLWIGSTEEKNAYDEVDKVRQQIVDDRAAIKGKLYPQRLNPLWKHSDVHLLKNARAIRTYTVWSVIAIFFIFSLVGWGYEVSIHLVKDGIFVNRGVMHGPWLPVYGSGVAMILVVLAKWRREPLKEAILTILLCGFVEYMTSLYFEITKGMRWWDYTGYFLNLNGRICGEGLMVFAIGGMAAVYLLVPLLDSYLSRINPKVLGTICVILLIIFSCDMVYSHNHPNIGEGITDYDAYQNESVIEYENGEDQILAALSLS